MGVRTLITSPKSSVVEDLNSDHRRLSHFTDMKVKVNETGNRVSRTLTHQIFHSMLGPMSASRSQ